MKNKDIKSIDETPDDENWRMVSILSYVIVLIAFGIPIWWLTTRVYRATLPLENMLQLNEIILSPLEVQIHATSNTRAYNLMQELQSVLGPTVLLSVYQGKLVLPISEEEDVIEKAAYKTLISSGKLLFVEWPASTKELTITSQRVIYFNNEINGYKLATLLQKWPGVDLKTALADPNINRVQEGDLRPFPAGPKFDVVLTVVNPDPKLTKINWDFLGAVNSYVRPFLNRLDIISNFTIKSQWLYFVDLGVKPRQVGNHWALAEQLLPHVITPLEDKLSGHVSKNPCINLVIYVPACNMAPIHIYTKKGVRSSGPVDAFISPRWGGIQIANPNCTSDVFSPNSQQIMSVITTQLSQLLGLSSLSLQFPETIRQTGLHPSFIQIDYLTRAHTLEYLTNSKLTLRSLAQLLSEINNIVINDDVAVSVRNAIINIRKAEEFLKTGQIDDAFKCSKDAAAAAESAFTNPSLLALLYFPDDQKYAVYIPLFLPIMIPVIMSMKQLLQYSKKKKTIQE